MTLAQFTGKSGEPVIYTDTNTYLLIGTGDKLAAGTEAGTRWQTFLGVKWNSVQTADA